MLCSKCGNNIPDDSKFCVHCGNKIEKVEVANSATENVCKGCKTVLAPGVKFCAKCGMKQESVSVERATAPTKPEHQTAPQTKSEQATAPQMKPVQQVKSQSGAVQQPVEKKKSPKALVAFLVLFLLIGIIGGACFYCVAVMDMHPLEVVSGLLDSSEDDEKGDSDDEDEDDEDGEAGEEEDEKQVPEDEKGDVALLEPANKLVEDAKTEYEAKNYLEGAIPYGKDAINQYVEIAEENNLHDEAQEGIDSVYWVYIESVIRYCDHMKTQGASAAGFEQISNTLADAMELTKMLSEKEYSVDSSELYTYKEETIQTFKDMYIESINGITEYANWSRDEAWNYAERAYSVKENGKPLLFDNEDLEDPLRMRYAYCLSWITRKRCETGLADGSMSNADVVARMELILEETDYNLMLIQDIITYGSAAGLDVEKYRNAYNAVVEQIKNEQGLTIGSEIGVNSRSSVDLNHFWYFNDLDGEDKYKVDTYNGTTAATREWIRSNVPVILSE